MIWVFAQEIIKTEPSGPSTWFPIILQGGSFGVLVYAILRLLPKAAARLLEAHEKAIETVKSERNEILKEMKNEHTENIAAFQRGMESAWEEVKEVRTRADARADRSADRIAGAMIGLGSKVDENTKATVNMEKAIIENTAILKKNGH